MPLPASDIDKVMDVVLFHSATDFVTIISAFPFISLALQSKVSGQQKERIYSRRFLLG